MESVYGEDSASCPGSGEKPFKTLAYAVSRVPYNTTGSIFEIILSNWDSGTRTYTLTSGLTIRSKAIRMYIETGVVLKFGADGYLTVTGPNAFCIINGSMDGSGGTITCSATGSGTNALDGVFVVNNGARLTFSAGITITASKIETILFRVSSRGFMSIEDSCAITVTSNTRVIYCYSAGQLVSLIPSRTTADFTVTVSDDLAVYCSSLSRMYCRYMDGSVVSGNSGFTAATGSIIQLGSHSLVIKGTSDAATMVASNGSRIYTGTQTSVGKY